MSEIMLTEENFQEEVLKAEGPVLVDFWATWCGPCKMIAPIVHQFAELHPEVKVCKLDVDGARSIAMEYDIQSIPTLVLFRGGQAVDRMIGVAGLDKIEALALK